MLLGGDVPFVVREREFGGVDMIGEAYVHGIMHGEVIREVNKGKCKTKRLVFH